MRSNYLKATVKTFVVAASVLLLASGMAFAQQQINLTAAPTTAVMPDGSTVPMWGYSCGAVVTGSTATCAALNKNAGTGWSPVVITVPTGQTLVINLTNSLSFTAGTGTNTVPTSLTIVGQLGGGLGTTATTVPSPTHSSQVVTWSTVGSAPAWYPPPQGPRVQSFATEVAAGATTALTWTTPQPGTYLIESGTHPSIQGPMGLYGMLVVTAAPTTAAGLETAAGTAYPAVGTTAAVTYDAEVPLLLSEIDPIQNNSVNAAVNTAGFSETTVWSGQPGQCGNPASTNYHTCYPPAVNYTPLYYMINGVAFSKSNASFSLFAASNTIATPPGNVLVRFVNAGLRMHLPSIVGAQTTQTVGTTTSVVNGFSLIAEDGNRLPGIPKVQSDVFMAAGKTYDVMINGPAAASTAPALPVYDRELSLSGNAVDRDAGMLAYIGVNGAALPVAPAIAAAVARADTYTALVAGQTLTVSDPAKGLIANDTNVYGVNLLTAPTSGTVTLNHDGTFTYVPTGTATLDSFSYCANGAVTGTTCSSGITATVTLSPSNIVDSGINCTPSAFGSTMATYLAVKTPGVLLGCTDAAHLPLTVLPSSVAPSQGQGLRLSRMRTAGLPQAPLRRAPTPSPSLRKTLTVYKAPPPPRPSPSRRLPDLW